MLCYNAVAGAKLSERCVAHQWKSAHEENRLEWFWLCCIICLYLGGHGLGLFWDAMMMEVWEVSFALIFASCGCDQSVFRRQAIQTFVGLSFIFRFVVRRFEFRKKYRKRNLTKVAHKNKSITTDEYTTSFEFIIKINTYNVNCALIFLHNYNSLDYNKLTFILRHQVNFVFIVCKYWNILPDLHHTNISKTLFLSVWIVRF